MTRVVFTISMLRKLCHRYLHFNLIYITDLETLVDILKGEIEEFVVENLHCGYLKAEVNSTFFRTLPILKIWKLI
jgi:hypothetical protein